MQTPIPTTSGPVTITPEQASAWLNERNTGNRSLSATTAHRYAAAMIDGRWKTTHQGVAFDEDGKLLDGQHRLLAVVYANRPVTMWVFTGMDRSVFDVLDVGRRRQAGHLIQSSYSALVAASCRYLGVIDGTLAATRGSYTDSKVDNDVILRVHAVWPELEEWAKDVNEVRRITKIVPAPHLAVVAQAARTRYADRLPSWFEGLKSGAGLGADDPRLLLRNRFIRDVKAFATAGGRDLAYRLVVKAWNAHATGEPIALLKAGRSEQVPVVAS